MHKIHNSLLSPSRPASYTAALHAAASADDWVTCVDLATEVRVLRLALPPGPLGAAARAVADCGGPWTKAVDLLAAAAAAPPADAHPLECLPFVAVFSQLAREKQGAAARDLLDTLTAAGAFDGRPPATRGAALNAAARACGRGGELDAGLELLGRLREGGLAVDDGTYSALSLACLGAGRAELATELLEERDYL